MKRKVKIGDILRINRKGQACLICNQWKDSIIWVAFSPNKTLTKKGTSIYKPKRILDKE